MGWFIPLIGNMLLQITGSIFAQVLVAAGVGVVSYKGADMALNFLKSNAISAALSMSPEVVGILALMQVGSCISLVFSAMVIRATLNGVGAGAKTWVKK